MLAKRIIPCLDVDAGRVVKGVSFVNLRDAGDPAELASFYDKEGADELVFLDITASVQHRNTMIEVVQAVSEQVFIPLTVGGGIRDNGDVRRMLQAGADKVAVNTAAVENPAVIADGAMEFGSQCIVVAIDAKRVTDTFTKPDSRGNTLALCPESRWEVYIHGGRTATGIDAIKWVERAVELGAGEVLLTSMDCDGQRSGYDLELTFAVARAVPVPVIASGGAGSLEHLRQATDVAEADAVLVASIFHYGEYSISQAKEYLATNGVSVRLSKPYAS